MASWNRLSLPLLLLIGAAPLAVASPIESLPLSEQSSPPPPPPRDPVDPDEIDVDRIDTGLVEGPRAPGGGNGRGGLREIGGAVSAAVTENWALTSAITGGLLVLGAASWILASRYVDPKVALKNPQRSMLYGFVKGNPGVHLKQLSTEFRMKTSTVLWHIRKLEHADLVRSRKANGYRVFYPVSGGLEAKQLSTAVTALGNVNAKQIFEFVAINPGAHRRILSSRLAINPGTVRWHLKKLREAGLVAELAQERFSTYYATELGLKAMRQVASLPEGIVAPAIALSQVPVPESLDGEPAMVAASH